MTRPPPRLSEQAFFGRLDLARPELLAVKSAAAAGAYTTASDALHAHCQARCVPVFFFAPHDVPVLTGLVSTEQRADTLSQADAVCQDVFQFRHAAPVHLKAGIDWRWQPNGNVDWNWDLNRHLIFETLGRAYAYTGIERYAAKFCALLLDWLAKNPPHLTCPTWFSVFEIAFRINTWLWAFHYFRGSTTFDADTCRAFIEGLLRHGELLEAQLELHAANNHLLLEAKALAMLGLAFPEFRHAPRWRQRGLALVWREVRAQVCPDGVHGERVTHYQRAIAGELLELLILLENNGEPIPPDIVATVGRMVEFELWVTKPDGLVPLFGDSGLADTHIRFSPTTAGAAWLGRPDWKIGEMALSEADIWLVGSERAQRYAGWPARGECLTSRAFADGGYYIMRHGQDPEAAYLALDAAPFGYEPVPAHGHADALSIEVYAFGQTFLVDPGGYATWAPPAWRNYFRGTSAHNTVMVDAQDQSILLGTRGVYRPARVTLHHWVSNPHFDLVDTSHSGYERLPGSIRHRRQVVFVKLGYWVVIDVLAGAGDHCFDLLYHGWPGLPVSLECERGVARVGRPDGPTLTILPVSNGRLEADVVTGATEPIQGWTALYSGEKEPAPVLRYRQTGTAPVEFCTVLHASPAGRNAAVQVRRLEVQPGPGQEQWPAAQVTGLQIETAAFRDGLVLDRGQCPRPKIVASRTSLAQVIYFRQRLPEGEISLWLEH